MPFDLAAFWRFTRTMLFGRKGTCYRWTLKRVAYLLGFYLLFAPALACAWIGFLLDEILYPAYRRQEVAEPVFIVGNPRSGTTFLHRLLARDEGRFLSTNTYELFLAPSIVQRKLFSALSRLDRVLGAPLHRLIDALQERWQRANAMHRVALREPEEDEYLLFYVWSCLKLWTFGAMLEEAQRYVYFDERMSSQDKRRIMSFYEGCLKRHLYYHGRSNVVYLAKNPSYTPMIDTLLQRYPKARIIYMARNPLDMIPSYISLTETEWQLLGNPCRPYAGRDWILQMADHWYHYPLERLAQEPKWRYTIVSLSELGGDVEKTVSDIYRRFDWSLSPRFERILCRETARARRHRSEHDYSLQEMGLTREEIVSRFRDVFDRFGFDTRQDVSTADL